MDRTDALLATANEILKLLRIIAEPELALQDKEPRGKLRQIVGKSAAKAQAVFLMDGTRSQSEIRQQVKIDGSDLSKMVKALRSAGLLKIDEKPTLSIYIPTRFFDGEGAS
ncbi:MAG TPA: hypothetical protein VEF76_04665 [Patescibacteria group bacterium]|nr:hypothetical protein [Patescibacteria group bacterium]